MIGSIIRRSADGLSLSFVLAASVLGCRLIGDPTPPPPPQSTSGPLTLPEETKHLKNVRQLTFGGQSAEAYFSLDDKYLIFQHQGEGVPCDQIYTIAVDTPDGKPATPKLVSTGKGRTTCAYFFPSGDRVLFSSTHAASPDCPPKPDYSHGYVWPIYDSYQIYTAKPDGSDVKQLTRAHGYNAESTITRDGKHIVFTSTRNGDLDIYTMNADGSNVKQLTNERGLRRRPLLVLRWQENRLPRRASQYARGNLRLQGSAFKRSDPTGQSGNLGYERGWFEQAPGDTQRRREFRALLASRRKTHRLRVEHGRSEERPRF